MAIVQSAGELVAAHRESALARSSLTLYSGRTHEYAELYRVQPNLRLVIRFLARNIAQLSLRPYRRVSATERIDLDRDHKLSKFLRNPTPSLPSPTTQYAFLRGIVEDLALYDRVFGLKMKNAASGDLNFVRVPPPLMRPIGASFFWPEGFEFLGNRDRKRYDPANVFYVHGHDPSDPKGGVSPAEALRQILAEDVAAGEYREQMWRNGARISGTLTRPTEAPKWADPARDRFLEEWNAHRTNLGPGAGGTAVLEDGMTFQEHGFSAKEAEYLGARRLTREETAAQYHIPPAFVGILENANFANIKEQHVSLYADTLGPWLEWIEQEAAAQIVPEFDDVEDVYLEFNIEEKMRGAFEDQASAFQSAAGAPYMLRNEIRAMRNLPPVPGGDDLVVPLNVLVGGQASPNDTDTSDEPGSLAAPAPATKAAPRTKALPSYLVGWQAKNEEVVSGFFERQKSSVLAKLGAGVDLEVAFDADRWNDELAADLLALSATQADEVGGALADEYDGEFDVGIAIPWLTENARIAAEGINGATLEAITAASAGMNRGALARKALDDELADLLGDAAATDDVEPAPDPLDPVRDVFTIAIAARSAQIATTRATSVGNWSRREAASQVGLRRKVWNVNSSGTASRHSGLDGESVPLGEPFSNGGQYPGDPSLGVDETAGCTCDLSFTT